ncbi:MAG: hypothetical protein IH941_05340 [Acidobacteria bacterium]|nr:hypothetical protein [Acidobacteriota bacterium]
MPGVVLGVNGFADLERVVIGVLSALPRRLVTSKKELTTRVLRAVRPSTVEAERILVRNITASLRSDALDSVGWVGWHHRSGTEAHAVFLRNVYPDPSRVRRLLEAEVAPLFPGWSWVARGTVAEVAVAGSLGVAGFTVGSYAEAGHPAWLDKAVDLAVFRGGRLVAGVEVKNYVNETLLRGASEYRRLARVHRDMGAAYAMVAPSAGLGFRESLRADSGAVFETGSYLVRDAGSLDRLLELGPAHHPRLVDRGQASESAEYRLPPDIADSIIGRLERLVPRQPLVCHEPRSRKAVVSVEGRFRRAINWYASSQCMACGTRLWASGSCVMSGCRLSGERQNHTPVRQELLALAVGVTSRTLRELPRRLGVPTPWKSRGRPRSENRNLEAQRPYAVPEWLEEVLLELE